MPISPFAIVSPVDREDMTNSPKTAIGKYILRVMQEEGMTATDVLASAKRMKVKLKQSTFSEVYSGESENPRIATLVSICKALGRPFEEMAKEIEGTPPAQRAEYQASDFAMLWQTYERLNAKEKRLADEFLEMLKRQLTEQLKRQGESNLLHLRK